MSENLSSKRLHHKLAARLRRKDAKEKRVYDWRMLFLLPAWVAAAYIASNLIIAAIILVMNWIHEPVDGLLRPAILQTAIATLIYILSIAIVVAGPFVLKRRRTTDLAALGLDRLASWSDIALAPLTFLVYTVVAGLALAIIAALVPAFPANQVQDTGFTAFGSQMDNILAFVTLVILAPLAEETLFRGYLYGKLRKYVPGVVAALMTSLLFAVAHFQWNVGIDVFVLSLFLCGLRSLTGSIWAGILVHMIKNGIAYYILFISPLIGG